KPKNKKDASMPSLLRTTYFALPPNSKYASLTTLVKDRLFKVHIRLTLLPVLPLLRQSRSHAVQDTHLWRDLTREYNGLEIIAVVSWAGIRSGSFQPCPSGLATRYKVHSESFAL
ncbi:hypothetical protein ACHAPI_012167, partial [Fusarium lateritium]